MSKKLFRLLVVLMSLSLIGIIFVQAYYINNAIENEEEQFWFKVKKVLNNTTKTIEDREYDASLEQLGSLLAQGAKPDTTDIRSLRFFKQNDDENGLVIYDNAILEENFRIATFNDIGVDSINFRRYTNRSKTQIFNDLDLDGDIAISPEITLEDIYKLDKLEREVFETTYRDIAKTTPIHKRVTEKEVTDLLNVGLRNEEIDIPYEFAIYSNELATKIQSDDFEFLGGQTKGYPIFSNINGDDFILYVSFPKRNKYVIASILGVTILSIIFTLIIIIAYTSAIYQLIRQRQISQIKTDFINNMTHEFKTPIATINLALDAIKNPKVINDEDKVKRYLNMIKDENKRMHAQVENVLRISKLEKNELNISKDRVKLHDLLEDAVTHIELIVEDRSGYIKTHLNASKSSVLANETHFTNVVVNILDNAVKYSDDEPKIDIYTENVGNSILLKIKDQGNGMSKSVQKKVFEKFYREHTGDVHNVKGHGLGLAYVKRIVEDHQGHVSIESEKGKGSTFIIKLPLIS